MSSGLMVMMDLRLHISTTMVGFVQLLLMAFLLKMLHDGRLIALVEGMRRGR